MFIIARFDGEIVIILLLYEYRKISASRDLQKIFCILVCAFKAEPTTLYRNRCSVTAIISNRHCPSYIRNAKCSRKRRVHGSGLQSLVPEISRINFFIKIIAPKFLSFT